MADVAAHQDHLGVSRIVNLPDAASAQEPATLAQLTAVANANQSAVDEVDLKLYLSL